MRSNRLLHGMHKVFSHDLPNQMVALQSLLQLLNAEEAEHLSTEGQEYVRRLQNATQRASEQVRFLKEMGRINTSNSKAETIALSTLARELQGELKQKHPQTEFAFEWQWAVPTIVADARSFTLALSELCAVFLQPHAKACQLSAQSRAEGDGVEVLFHLDERLSSAGGALPRWTPQAVEQRMEIVLAREWLALSQADLEVMLPAERSVRFSIVVPSRRHEQESPRLGKSLCP